TKSPTMRRKTKAVDTRPRYHTASALAAQHARKQVHCGSLPVLDVTRRRLRLACASRDLHARWPDARRATLLARTARAHGSGTREQLRGQFEDPLGQPDSTRNVIEEKQRGIEVGTDRARGLARALVVQRSPDVVRLAHQRDRGHGLERSSDPSESVDGSGPTEVLKND